MKKDKTTFIKIYKKMFLKKISLFLVSALLMISSTYGQDEQPASDDFKPSGKPFVKIFTNKQIFRVCPNFIYNTFSM